MQQQILDKYNRDLHNALRELLERTRQAQTNLIMRKSSGMANTFTPGSTCEEIAMTAIEQASRARTLEEVLELTSRVYSSLFQREVSDGNR